MKGMKLDIHTFGVYVGWHPRIHVLNTDGLFRENSVVYVMPRIAIKPLRKIFKAKVLEMLKKEEGDA